MCERIRGYSFYSREKPSCTKKYINHNLQDEIFLSKSEKKQQLYSFVRNWKYFHGAFVSLKSISIALINRHRNPISWIIFLLFLGLHVKYIFPYVCIMWISVYFRKYLWRWCWNWIYIVCKSLFVIYEKNVNHLYWLYHNVFHFTNTINVISQFTYSLAFNLM